MTIADLAREIVDFCSPAERTHLDLQQRFAHAGVEGQRAVWHAIDSGKLKRWSVPDGWRYRAVFDGVDIDRVHRVRRPGEVAQ
ncbi:MAG TPA: hypothetical protein VGF12_00980 [Roseateles sp.]|uniref:hypothetical protein n=1 Tax=Roseateles sp. TaxID=1971397 RepID=UPI002EDAC122